MSSQTNSMKQIGARNVGCTVDCMEWSNKMDLIAYGNSKGEVIIQRLNWQKIVTIPAPKENVKVRSLSWQQDETMLAVGYSNGSLALVDAETETVVTTLEYGEEIKHAYFSKAINTPNYKNTFRNQTELTHDAFLPALPALSGFSAAHKSTGSHKSFAKGLPCFLVVRLVNGQIHLLLLGALKAGSIQLSRHVAHPDDFEVYDARLNSTFNALYALVRDGNQLNVLYFHNAVLQQYISPLLHLAVHAANILETKNYINDTVKCMLEAWETVLLEMDNKLTKYANSQPDGTLSADFLEFLVFGYATHEIEEFLMEDLTEKGLKKLANSVDLSYSTLQSLVTKPLQSAALNMFYFFNTVKGLSRMSYFFETLLVPEDAEEALRQCGSFILKVQELDQVIDECVTDMQLFFNWMGVVLARLHQHDVSEEIRKITPEDTIYLAEYLNNFEEKTIENADGSFTKRKFNLEKVGQYLENKPLQQPVKSVEQHLWNKLLEDNECLRQTALIYAHEKDASFLQQRDKLLAVIERVFGKPNESLSAGFELQASITCCTLETQPSTSTAQNEQFMRASYSCYSDKTADEAKECDILLFTISWQEALVLEFDTSFTCLKCIRLQLLPSPFTCDLSSTLHNLRFVDLQFYNENTISLLLKGAHEQEAQNVFLQLALDTLRSKATLHLLPKNVNLMDVSVAHSIHDIVESGNFKSLEGVCTQIAVSGSRKVATVLSDSGKKMTIFEMEVEDDDDDTEISQNTLLEISKESESTENE